MIVEEEAFREVWGMVWKGAVWKGVVWRGVVWRVWFRRWDLEEDGERRGVDFFFFF